MMVDISQINLDCLSLSRAQLSDYDAILDISVGVYEGHDYLPNCYRAWVEEERRNPRKRINVVLVQLKRGGDSSRQILGFKSFMFQDDMKKVVEQALRIHPGVKGMGVGRKFISLGKELLRRINPNIDVISCLWHKGVHPVKIKDGSLGRVIATRVNLFLEMDNVGSVIKALAQLKKGGDQGNSCSSEKMVEQLPLKIVTKSQLAEVLLQSADARERLMEENYLTPMWVPHHCVTQEDFENIRPIESEITIRLDKDENNAESLSILSHPTLSPGGINIGFDHFGHCRKSVEPHFMECMEQIARMPGLSSGQSKIQLWIACTFPVLGTLRKLVEDKFAGVCRSHVSQYYPQEEENPIYYIMEQKLG